MQNKEIFAEFNKFLLKADLAQISIKGYLQDIKFFLKWLEDLYCQEVPLENISIDDLQAFRQTLSDNKRQKPSSINRKIQSIKRFFNWLYSNKIISENPSATLHFVRRSSPSRPKSLNKKQTHALLRAAGMSSYGTAKRNYACLQLILQTGLRISEILALQIRDLIIKERSGMVKIISSKGRKYRNISLNATARRALSTYLNSRKEAKAQDYVFINKFGTQMSSRAIQKMISSLACNAGIDNASVTAHALRHTFATYYLRSNPDGLQELSSILGHESLDTTAIYTKPTIEKIAENMEKSELNIYHD